MTTDNEKIADIVRRAGSETAKTMLPLIEEAYAQGWDDACREITESAKVVRATASFSVKSTLTASTRVVRENPFDPPKINSSEKPKRAPWGLSGQAIAEALKRAGPRGIDFMDVQSAARDIGKCALAESSIRSTLLDLQAKRRVERREGRWYWVRERFDPEPERETAGHAHEADPAAPVTHNQGAPNGTALVNP